MKKTLIVLAAVALCASLLFGCSPAAQTPPDDTSEPGITPAPGIEGNAGENAAEEESPATSGRTRTAKLTLQSSAQPASFLDEVPKSMISAHAVGFD